MWFIEVIVLIIGGALAIPNLVLGKVPNATEILKKVAPFQSWIGLGLLVWGIWDFISVLLNTGSWVSGWGFITYITMIAVCVVEAGLGLILSMNFLKTRKEIPQDKLEQLEKMITGFQVPLGLGGIIGGLYILIRFTVLGGLQF